MAILVVGKR